ncbi:hypothetical protein KSS87_023890 [Heliosperma pusillum]|nr:hypothetical protein KSS87_023890 [Heliosperma pusillum]
MTGNPAKKGLDGYMKQLQQHPLRTKAITAGVITAISDIVSQKLSGIQKLQIRRLLLKVLFGCAYLGPFGHYFHMLLDKIFKGKKDSKTVAKKVIFEQFTSSPLNNILFMVYYGCVVEVLASVWMDKLPVCSVASTCGLPEHDRVLLETEHCSNKVPMLYFFIFGIRDCPLTDLMECSYGQYMRDMGQSMVWTMALRNKHRATTIGEDSNMRQSATCAPLG